jgi:GNAT superfamily N-acetyltransferase
MDVAAICRICAAGYRLTTRGLLPDETVDRLVEDFYSVERVTGEVAPTGRSWQGYLVAEVDGEVVGAAGGGMVADHVGQLYVIYLDLDRRGRGLGTALLEEVTRQQLALGATRQRVSVLAGNAHGVPFYRARGFTDLATRLYPDAGPVRVPALLLERRIG